MKYMSTLDSLRYASRGIRYTFRNERNFRIEVLFGVFALALAWYFPLRRSEFVVIIFSVLFVLILELLNTAIEVLADLMKPRLHDQVEVIKNITASMVLLASLGAAVAGLVIFLPYLVELWPQS